MRPSDFVSRVVSLFDFDLNDQMQKQKATSFAEAQLYILHSLSGREFLRLDMDCYTFRLEAASVLGHQILRASMNPATTPKQIIRASVCFTLQDYETGTTTDRENMYETYKLSHQFREDELLMIDMLTYLTLKTNKMAWSKFN